MSMMLVAYAVVLAIIPTNDLEKAGAVKKAKSAPLNGDLPYLECPVCEKAMSEAMKQVTALVAADTTQKPKKGAKRRFESANNLGDVEGHTEEFLRDMCVPDNDGLKEYGKPRRSPAGVWLAELDVVKQGSHLVLDHRGSGHCRRECRTLAKSCEALMDRLGDGDDDLSAYLVSAAREQVAESAVVHKVCHQMAGVCTPAKRKTWKEGRVRKNEQFKPKTEEEKRQELMLETMAGENGNGITMMKPGDYDFPDGYGDLGGNVDDIDVLKDEL